MFGDPHSPCRLCALSQQETGTNCLTCFTPQERKSDSSHSKQPGNVINPELFLLDELHLLSEDLKSFHNPSFNVGAAASGHVGTIWPLQNCSPWESSTSAGLCLALAAKQEELGQFDIRLRGQTDGRQSCCLLPRVRSYFGSQSSSFPPGDLQQLQPLPSKTWPKTLTSGASCFLASIKIEILGEAGKNKSGIATAL